MGRVFFIGRILLCVLTIATVSLEAEVKNTEKEVMFYSDAV